MVPARVDKTHPEQLDEAAPPDLASTGTGIMTLHPCCVGIDISKAMLDIFESDTGRHARIANDDEAIAQACRPWSERGATIVYEATGCYDTRLRTALDKAGIAHIRVNPERARHFARYAGFTAKTDRIDARMLAEMGRHGGLTPEPPLDPCREALRALHRRRDQLVAHRKAERQRIADAIDDTERGSIDRHIAFLDTEVETLDRAITRQLADNADLRRIEIRLRSIPNIGPVAATTLIALMPELGSRSPKAIACLAGLAPINRDSGSHFGARSIAGGRKRVRDALYMAAVSATRSDKAFGAFYKKLRDNGKPPKLALIAVARKILTTANAVIRDDTPYRNTSATP
jgi:transposase